MTQPILTNSGIVCSLTKRIEERVEALQKSKTLTIDRFERTTILGIKITVIMENTPSMSETPGGPEMSLKCPIYIKMTNGAMLGFPTEEDLALFMLYHHYEWDDDIQERVVLIQYSEAGILVGGVAIGTVTRMGFR